MIVKYIGADGKVLRAFTGASSMHLHDGNNLVSINRNMVHLDKSPDVEVANFRSYSYEYPIALINLAPGESLEREDEPTRS